MRLNTAAKIEAGRAEWARVPRYDAKLRELMAL